MPKAGSTGKIGADDEMAERVGNREEVGFRCVVRHNRGRGDPDKNQAASMLAQEVIAGRLKLEAWNDKAEQFIVRLNCLTKWMPELDLPPITDEDRPLLIEQVCQGCTMYKEIREKPVDHALQQWLSHSQRELLDKFAPTSLTLKNGKNARITYDEKQQPSVRVVIQQLYDVNENPKVAACPIHLVVELLSPTHLPHQNTC